jgi:molybdenum cofactor sulfurtransferase
MDHIATHVAALTRYCTAKLQSLVHPSTSQKLCTIYSLSTLLSNDPRQHGGTIAFNLRSANGSPFPYRSVECAANAAGIYVRSGAMCNPGGMATYLDWTSEELGELFQAGSRCSKPVEVWKGKWTGVVRVSFGAVSTRADVDQLIDFLLVTYVESRN